MATQESTTSQKLVAALRNRALKLRHQAIWAQQASADAYGNLHLTYVVDEVLALREESMVLDQLADQYERKHSLANVQAD